MIQTGLLNMNTLSSYHLCETENILEWIDKADFYNEMSEHIIYFRNIAELLTLINTYDFSQHSYKMQIYNETRKQDIYKKWKHLMISEQTY